MSQIGFSIWKYYWNFMHHLFWPIMCISSCYWKPGYLVWCLLSFGYRDAFDATSIILSLNAYFDKYLEIIATFNDFTIQHVFRDKKYSGERFSTSIRFSIKSRKMYVLENQMFQFTIPDVPVCSRCTMLKYVLLSQAQQNWMFWNQKPEGLIFLEVRTIWAKQRQLNLWIGGHPLYII
jgi:hypothetical protein